MTHHTESEKIKMGKEEKAQFIFYLAFLISWIVLIYTIEFIQMIFASLGFMSAVFIIYLRR